MLMDGGQRSLTPSFHPTFQLITSLFFNETKTKQVTEAKFADCEHDNPKGMLSDI